MSCWVAPAIAAEFWRVSLDEVRQRMADGSVRTRTEEGFTFVDVLPDVSGPPAPPPQPQYPPTYVVVSRDELTALGVPEDKRVDDASAPDDFEHTIDPAEHTSDDDGQLPAFSWSHARRRAARTRIPPRKLAA